MDSKKAMQEADKKHSGTLPDEKEPFSTNSAALKDMFYVHVHYCYWRNLSLDSSSHFACKRHLAYHIHRSIWSVSQTITQPTSSDETMNLVDLMCCRNNNAAVVFVSPNAIPSAAQDTLRSSSSLDLETELFREFQSRAERSELRLRNAQSSNSLRGIWLLMIKVHLGDAVMWFDWIGKRFNGKIYVLET